MTSDADRFREAVTALLALYPSAKIDEHQIRMYWRLLEPFGWPAVKQALAAVPSLHPQFFPSGAQIAQIAKGKQRGAGIIAKANETRKALPLPRRADPYKSGDPPETQEGMAKYIEAAQGEWEQLARLWECETKATGSARSAPLSESKAKARFRQFWKTWGKTEGGK
jgi:hypothetical protein